MNTRKIYFDKKFTLVEDYTEDSIHFLIRIDGRIVAETEDSYKIKTTNFWGNYQGIQYLEKPLRKSSVLNNWPYVNRHYWVSKEEVKEFK